ncbi:heme exporter protein CcmB [Roseomonas nepalensis]|uniref:Heme exporter protein B n=1 Tax=Muricoccus nepalensis TaxID=1854500 RepID=A0A502FGA6_9PROT|nr:heme exporter protein CcmB [Roseomonas nepalensis]TPG48379.1 heme exporter protein CcmB [Roseomonas nepalensis]
MIAVFLRELRLALRHPAEALAAVLFFVIVCALFPFGVGPSPEALARLAPGALVTAALLAALLPLDRLFAAEAEDGSLDLLLTTGLPPAGLAAAKAAAHWVVTGLPLLLATPIASALLALPAEAWGVAVLALGLASAVLSLLGTLGAALTLGARRGGVLLPLLVLPLAVPVVIFAAGAIEAASAGAEPRPFLLLLAAFLAGALPLAPLAAGAALREG